MRDSVARFDAAMDDDLNTADAMGALFEIVREGNVNLNANSAKAAVQGVLQTLQELCDVLGLLIKPYEEKLPDDVRALADERAAARKNRDWKRSDELRDAIRQLGYAIEDTPQGQKIQKM